MTTSLLDGAVVFAYLAGIIILGITVARRKRATTTDSYFLGNRNSAWPFLGMSLFASSISSMQFVGQAGLAYKIGIAAANPQLLGAFMLGVSAVFFAPLFVRSRIHTLPDLLELRYSRTAKLIFSFTIVTVGILLSPFGFYAGGLAILKVFKIDASYLWLCCLMIGGVVGLYSILGGLASEMIMDFVQGCILLLGGIIVVVAALLRLPGTAGDFEPGQLDLVLPATDTEMPWTGVFSGLSVASLFFATTNAGLMQRVLSARDVYHARCGLLFAAALKILAMFVIVFPGVLAARLFPGINPDAAFPTLVDELLLPGFSGLVLAAMMAALLSTADTAVNNLSSIVTLNLYPLVRPQASPRNALLVGRFTAGAILIWSAVAASFVGEVGLIFPLTLKISAYLLGPVGVCYFYGRFSRRANATGAITVLVAGYMLGLYLVLGTSFEPLHQFVPAIVTGTHFYHVSFTLVVFYAILLPVVSHFTAPPCPAQVEAVQLSLRSESTPARPWFQRYEFWGSVLLLTFAAVYALF